MEEGEETLGEITLDQMDHICFIVRQGAGVGESEGWKRLGVPVGRRGGTGLRGRGGREVWERGVLDCS